MRPMVLMKKYLQQIEVQYFDYTHRETLRISIGKEKGMMVRLNKFVTQGISDF
jgi:hypothetical protein